MLRVACKKDNSANLHFQIISPDPCFYFIFVSGAQSASITNILMVLNRIMEQVRVECHMQE